MGTHGATVDLAPSLDGATSVVPTFAPTLMERPMHTRAASSAPERRQRSVQVGYCQALERNDPFKAFPSGGSRKD